jgi:GWxTD domain-containing protein
MTHLETWIESRTALAIAMTLLHSLWQSGLVATVLAVSLHFIHSSRARYAAACIALTALVAASIGTFIVLAPMPAVPAALQPTAHSVFAPLVPAGDAATTPTRWTLREALPLITPLWLFGFVLFNLRQVGSWAAARRMRQRGVCLAPDVWQQRLDVLRTRLKLLKSVLLLESCMAQVPVVIGHFRPAILVPIGFLTAVPPEQIEFLLLHELSHVRRADYLINIFQGMAENVMFYNPFVWWASGLIRIEREHCCDDVVIQTTSRADVYAATLIALEENRSRPAHFAIAATGGTLMKRIRRVLGQPEQVASPLVPVIGALIMVAVLAVLVMARPASVGVRAASVTRGVETHPTPTVEAVLTTPSPAKEPTAAVRAQTTPPVQPWLDQDVVYIITAEERAAFLMLTNNEVRARFIEQFWQRRDPTPGTPENEFKQEHYRRIDYANSQFGTRQATPPVAGWRTDRGRTYIMYGRPDEIESHPSGGTYDRPTQQGGGTTTTFPFEIWLYRYIEGIGNDVLLEFVDPSMSGEYHLTIDPSEKDALRKLPQR